MGYRSTVIFGIKKDTNEDKLIEIIDKHYGEEQSIFEIHENDEYLIFEGHSLKWYNSYNDVEEINNFISEASLKDDSVFMVCLGEDGHLHDEIGLWFDFCGKYSYLELN
tara:strand:- start:89 stop:415 length:327 start_codon:yes stop_codon:yes gene_type:complete